MAGHSKWANIQHRKKKQDAKRGTAFTKLIRAITVAARQGGESIDSNPALRLAVDTALGQNMKRDVIDRAIKRGAGGLEGKDVVEIAYEGYGPGGVAVLVQCMTDNKNRTVAEVRHAFGKAGGQLGSEGSVAYLFDKRGVLLFESVANVDALMEAALSMSVEDFDEQDQMVQVTTDAADFFKVKSQFAEAGFEPSNAQMTMVASTLAAIDSPKVAQQLLALVERLEDLDDVQAVHHNAEIDEALLGE